MHTERTQNAHTQNRTQDTTICSTQNTEQRAQNGTQHTETNTLAENNAQPQHSCSTYDLHKYSFDLYHEQIYINNSNTIELYKISKENI